MNYTSTTHIPYVTTQSIRSWSIRFGNYRMTTRSSKVLKNESHLSLNLWQKRVAVTTHLYLPRGTYSSNNISLSWPLLIITHVTLILMNGPYVNISTKLVGWIEGRRKLKTFFSNYMMSTLMTFFDVWLKGTEQRGDIVIEIRV